MKQNQKANSSGKSQELARSSHSSYRKYTCQYRCKPIFTRLTDDAGYPQEILNPQRFSPPPGDYLRKNRRNLKNFFEDRIPAEDKLLQHLMKRQPDTLHPRRIFEIKQMQFQLKDRAKVHLHSTLQAALQKSPQSRLQKVEGNFYNKGESSKASRKPKLSFYQSFNYQRGTESHIGKRSKILKKEAYNKVFGPDISDLSRTAGFNRKTERKSPPARTKSTALSPTQKDNDQHQNLRILIVKMNAYKNKLEDRNDECHLPKQEIWHTEEEEKLITTVKNMTKIYQGRSADEGRQKLEKLEDLNTLDKEFYSSLLNHKNNRLNRRRELITQTIAFTDAYSPEKHFQSAQLASDHHSRSAVSLDFDDQNVDNDEMQRHVDGPRHSVRSHFALLKLTLVKWAALFYIYNIKRAHIFLAFKPSPQPYELQGSYAFFKCIKMGDLESVLTFLAKNPLFLFQVEFNGKSPISYACIFNQLAIAQLILQEGVNSDRPCKSGKTSLFYALHTRNPALIQAVLEHGASPWSTAKNPYCKIIPKGPNSKEIVILFNNARKVHMGMQLQATISKRREFWERYSPRIGNETALHYGFHGK